MTTLTTRGIVYTELRKLTKLVKEKLFMRRCCDCNKTFKEEDSAYITVYDYISTWCDMIACCPFCGSELAEEVDGEN